MNREDDFLVRVQSFENTHEAYLAKGRLEEEGIPAVLDGEHHVTMNWLISNAVGGVKLLVRTQDEKIARKILALDKGTVTDEVTADPTKVDRARESLRLCPACHSSNVRFEKISRTVAFISILLLGFPLLFFTRKMVCENCGYRWSP
jgi:rubredoxin